MIPGSTIWSTKKNPFFWGGGGGTRRARGMSEADAGIRTRPIKCEHTIKHYCFKDIDIYREWQISSSTPDIGARWCSPQIPKTIGMIRRLRWRFSPAVLKKIFIGAVQAKLEYACAVWSGGFTQKLQKLCTSFSRRNGTALQPLQKKFDYHTLVTFYKIHSRNAPPYLTPLLPPLSLSSDYTFRKLSYRKFSAVKRTSTMNSFLPRAVDLWNELPMDIQQSSSTFIFKKCLRTHLKF